MDTLISKSTFYDAVSMIIPGFITLFSLAQIFNIGCSYFTNKTLAVPYYICIFALSYLVGLLIHRFSQCCFDRWLRNNPKHIKEAKEKFEKEKMGRPNVKILNMRAKICPSKRNKGEEVFYNMHDYYTNYYSTIQNSSIPVMEAQVAFIRSMLVVFLIIIIALAVSFLNVDCIIKEIRSCKKVVVMLLLLIMGLFLKYLMFHIQKKIYSSVFEDSYYINGLKKKIKKEL